MNERLLERVERPRAFRPSLRQRESEHAPGEGEAAVVAELGERLDRLPAGRLNLVEVELRVRKARPEAVDERKLLRRPARRDAVAAS